MQNKTQIFLGLRSFNTDKCFYKYSSETFSKTCNNIEKFLIVVLMKIQFKIRYFCHNKYQLQY